MRICHVEEILDNGGVCALVGGEQVAVGAAEDQGGAGYGLGQGSQRRDLLDQRGQALAGQVPLVAFPDPPAVGQPAHVVLQAVAQQLRVAPRVDGHGPRHRLVK